MAMPPNTETFKHAADFVRNWTHPVLITHARPDGDALGSLAAMRLAFKALGIEASAVVFDDPPKRYKFIAPLGGYKLWRHDITELHLTPADGIVLLDTCAARQIEPLAEWVSASTLPTIVVDHHVSRDIPTDLELIDESASATCLILYDWFQAAGWSITKECATALFVGLSTDTGWFRHSNTDRKTMAAAGELIELGCKPHQLYDMLFQHESPARYRLRTAATGRTELLADGRLAVMTIDKQTFAQCAASQADTEDLVNEPLRIGSVIASALLVEHDANEIRVSFRSRAPGTRGVPDVDVAALAAEFGGGGHRRAAGARITGSLDQVKRRIVDRLERALSSS